MKTIEQIIELSKNPHYTLSEEETTRLRDYQKVNKDENRKNKNRIQKHDVEIETHNTEIKE